MKRLVAKYELALPLAVLGFGLLLILAVFSFISGKQYIQSNQGQNRSVEVIAALQRINLAVERAESAYRGLIVTGNSDISAVFDQSVKWASADIDKLMNLVSDHPEQLLSAQRLQGEFSVHLKKWRAGIKLPKSATRESQKYHIESVRPQLLIVRDAINQILSEEQSLYDQRTKQTKKVFNFSIYLILAGNFLSMVLMLWVLLVLRNVSKKRQIAEQTANEASALKSKFLANMSHEIRTPLNGIIGMSRLLAETPMNTEQKDYVSIIQDSSNSLLALINQILDISKIESGKFQLEETHFELRSLIESTMSILAPSANFKKVQLKLELSEDVPDLYIGDPLRIRQVLLNLLNNAIKFSSVGTVELKIKRVLEAHSMITLAFEVTDQGIGMDEKTMGRLFHSFSQGDESTTRKYGGTGLGLSISKQLVELMGGKISVSSEVGKGSQFSFQITLKADKYKFNADVTTTKPDGAMLLAHVLVAEDNFTNQKVVGAMLRHMGCTSEIANNGKEAIELLKEKQFDLILMDGQMPLMDGYETTRKIRLGEAGESKTKITIIAVTANAIKGDVERCFEAGMDDYVSKPISEDDLEAKIVKWINTGDRSLDQNVLRKLRELGVETNENLVQEVITYFESTTPAAIKDLRKLLSQGKVKELGELAHKLKSTFMNVGAIRMRNLARRLETAQTGDDLQIVKSLIDELESEFHIVCREIKSNVAA